MEVMELVLLAIEALKNNLVRTILTMLGVIIGIASVIVIISLGQGATQSIVDDISSFGANVINISAGRGGFGRPGGGGTTDTLTLEDAEAIGRLANVTAVSGVASTNKQIVYDGQTINTSITGVESSYEEIQSITLTQGSFFSDAQVATRAKVVLMGDELVTDLFGEDAQVVGETLRIDGKTFRISGVIQDSSSVLVPLGTVQHVLLNQDYLGSISVAVSDSELVEATQTQIEDLLLVRHKLASSDEADFNVRSSQEIISSVSSVTGTLTAMLSGIAAISLVVGGIGIMNIMLVTVTERTKEIGLLKAIGAQKQDILAQFLIESVVVTVVGGMIGMVLGMGITFVAAQLLSIPFVVKISSVMLSLGVSSGVGVVFGWYPARKAANLQPIDALRYE